MKIGFFTDTYFPQVSGVATSIKTLKEELEKYGHQVYIFTTTDPNADPFEEDIIRMPSVPLISFKDRRIVVRGMWYAYQAAKELELDLIHTHTEFGAGMLGKMVGKKLHIPVVHTYHTMYEDYLHYIAKGKVLRPSHVKYLSRLFANHSTGVVCPSQRVIDKLQEYGVVSPMRTIPTGIKIEKFQRQDITEEEIQALRTKLQIDQASPVILSLSRISYEKNIQAIIQGLPEIREHFPTMRCVIVGDGPYMKRLEQQVASLGLTDCVIFVGEVPNDQVAIYYKAADYFVSASTSETQGLTYTEALAAGVPCVVAGNDYLRTVFDHESLGKLFATDADFAKTFIAYAKTQHEVDPTRLANKLHEISAEYFGEQMFSFYEEMQAYHINYLANKKEKTAMKQIKGKLTSLKK